ncbi:hemolytic domain-containing protein [Geothermobacter ehrlichii]|uniref:Hemolytic domain-containing protein n=1 Tax=Geothermobacter ehrlichii TaxID=213224 RepID=A0A5D3WHH8_9BACT|nr:membrane protein insertion efficiency factor YidD [Geothermobacter ehrlichii]TYO98246.1 hemolytic domain-containing protein [Geothermobacter ehrlichii]
MSRRLLFVLLFLLPATPLWSAASDWQPWDGKSRKEMPIEADGPAFDQAIRFFQHYISPVDGARCPMYPTCSAYARQALARHGPWLGILLTVDRLIHENDPRERRRPVLVGDRYRYFDPVEANDFWLGHPAAAPDPPDGQPPRSRMDSGQITQ